MRKMLLFVVFLASCLSPYTARPVDLIQPGPIMCQPLNEDLEDCTDGIGHPWRCDFISGRWSCYQLMLFSEEPIR